MFRDGPPDRNWNLCSKRRLGPRARTGVLEIQTMKRLLLIGFAACGLALAPNVSASAMPSVTPAALASTIDGGVIQVRHRGYGHAYVGRGHGRTYVGRANRGHHYGWNRGRGHRDGWSRGRHRGW